jgi:deoxyribose-phosphate aldolase
VKASDGIHTADAALAMVATGATRIGASSTAAIRDGLRPRAEASERR